MDALLVFDLSLVLSASGYSKYLLTRKLNTPKRSILPSGPYVQLLLPFSIQPHHAHRKPLSTILSSHQISQ